MVFFLNHSMKVSALLFRVFLIGLLFYPIVVSHAHIVLNHEHFECETSEIHFHELEQCCDLLDYVNTNPFVLFSSKFINLIFFLGEAASYDDTNYIFSLIAKNLRGPPVFK